MTLFLCSPAVGLTAAAAAAAAATNAAIAEAMKVKKIKLEVMSSYHGSNTQHGADFENGDLSSSVGESPSTSSMTHTACRPGISKRLTIRHKWSGKTHCSLHLGVTYFSNVSSVTHDFEGRVSFTVCNWPFFRYILLTEFQMLMLCDLSLLLLSSLVRVYEKLFSFKATCRHNAHE